MKNEMKKIILFLTLIISINCFSQREAANWFFGDRAGIKFNADNTIRVLSTSPNPITMSTNEGCSSFSDSNGNLLLYTDGRNVWDRNHLLMPNGNYNTGRGLLGDPSSTQSGIIIPKPGDPNIFYIFTVDEPHQDNAAVYPNQFTGNYSDTGDSVPTADDGFNNGLNYSIVDMSIIGSNGSVGDVTRRNTHLITYDTNVAGEEIKFKCSEKITAVKSANGDGYWMITHFIDKFYAFKIDLTGVNPTPVVTAINPLVPVSGYRRNAIGQIKVSPNGKKIAIAHNQIGTTTGGTTNNGVVYLYDFDNQTGAVSNGILLLENENPYGIEFSAKTKKLYASIPNQIWQFDLESANIPNSGIRIATQTGSGASLQLGPDGKIYKANVSSDTEFIDAINRPELNGTACNYQKNAVSLGTGRSRFGLPPFISSVFSSSIIAENTCLGTPTNFSLDVDGTLDSVAWDFGDGSPTTTTISPNHTYANPGIYTISALSIIEGNPFPSSKSIEIYSLPQAIPSVLEQCSPNASVTNIFFNLNEANQMLTNGIANRTTSFFTKEADAKSNINSIGAIYQNTSNNQILFVRVTDTNTGCFSITQLELVVNLSSPNSYEIQECDNDGTEDGFFNFRLSDALIGDDFSTSAIITYYKNTDDALLKQNAIIGNFTNTIINSQTIYARVEDAGKCQGIFPIKLTVNPLPQIEIQATNYVCINLPNKYTTLDAGLLQGNPLNYKYEWSTGALTPTIRVNQPGTYTVKVIDNDPIKNCEKTRTITVLPSNDATIQEVVIADLTPNNTITVLLTTGSIGDYSYSLDLPNGPFQQSNYFENVPAGFHTVYVKDNRGCGTTPMEISVLKIPKFFTPNGDGNNDTWDIVGINPQFYAKSKIYIFDRYGKLLGDIKPLSNGWDGIYNGKPLPSSDYWYLVEFDNGRTIRGHFSLVR